MASFGGPTREYQVRVDPEQADRLRAEPGQVEQQLTNNNVNAGGSFIEAGLQQINVREVGLVKNVHDIENTVLLTKNGTPLRVKDIAVVAQGPKIRLGQFARAIHREDGKIIDNDDVVSGMVPMRKGADAEAALEGLHAKVKELNDHILPPGVKIVPFIDRSDWCIFTTHTVLHNLTEGIILVVIILLLFLGNVRGAIIVALTIPFSLLFAAILSEAERHSGQPALAGRAGFRHGGGWRGGDGGEHRAPPGPSRADSRHSEGDDLRGGARSAAAGVLRHRHHHHAYLPIFTLQRVEGRLFKPMAWTVAFALLGALMFSMLVAPVLASFFFPTRHARMAQPGDGLAHRDVPRCRCAGPSQHRWVTVGVGVAQPVPGAFIWSTSGVIGSEFLPHLDEGALLGARHAGAQHRARPKASALANQARILLCSFPEVTECTSQVGRPDDGTDTTGFFNTEYFVGLKPKEQWRPVFHQNKDELIAAMDRELEKIPGVHLELLAAHRRQHGGGGQRRKGRTGHQGLWRRSEDAGGKGRRDRQGHARRQGIEDLGVFRVLGQPNLNVDSGSHSRRRATRSTWPTCRTPSRPPWAATR